MSPARPPHTTSCRLRCMLGFACPRTPRRWARFCWPKKPVKSSSVTLRITPLNRFTSRTLTDKNSLRARLQTVKNHGYALVDQELEIGLRSIAVPVHDQQGKVIAAMNIGAHAARISKSKMLRDYLPHLQTAAQKISHVV